MRSRKNRITAYMMSAVMLMCSAVDNGQVYAKNTEETVGISDNSINTEYTSSENSDDISAEYSNDLIDGYEEKSWDNTASVANDDLSIGQIDSMIEGESPDSKSTGTTTQKSSYVPNTEPGSAFPAVYSDETAIKNYLKEHVPPTRNQGTFGSCWAHSVAAAAELYMINQKNADRDSVNISERHIARYTYGDGEPHMISDELSGDKVVVKSTGHSTSGSYTYADEIALLNSGGNMGHAASALARWNGYTDESDAPYPTTQSTDNKILPEISWNKYMQYNDTERLEDCYIINIKNNPELAKKYIMSYGGIAETFKADDANNPSAGAFYDQSYNSFYNNRDTDTNHTIVIVGWDDNYPKSRFKYTPPENGAWLVRNSWMAEGSSPEFGYSSYFWISYCDKSLNDSAYVYKLQDDSEWKDNNYYYCTKVGDYGKFGADNCKSANVYTASSALGKELLESVSIQSFATTIGSEGMPYKIEIYTGLKKGDNPDAGTLATTQEGILPFNGLFTIDLDNPVELKNGDRFSIVVTLNNGKDSVDYEFSNSVTAVSYEATCGEAGQSLFLIGTWKNVSEYNKGNFFIGAQTVDVPTFNAEVANDHNSVLLSWNPGNSYTGYEIRRSNSIDGLFSTVGRVNAGTSTYTDNTVSKDNIYFYKLFPVKGNVTDINASSDPVYVNTCDSQAVQYLTTSDLTLNTDKLDKDQLFTGKEQYVTVNGPEDYYGMIEVWYQRIKNGSGEEVTEDASTHKPVNAGTYKVIIKAKEYGKYKESEVTSDEWNIVIKRITIKDGTCIVKENPVYDGTDHRNRVVVYYNDYKMLKNTDFELTTSIYSDLYGDYGNNIVKYTGDISIGIKGIGENFEGDGYIDYCTMPARILVKPSEGQSKNKGDNDPDTYTYTLDTGNVVSGQTPSITGKLGREQGEKIGEYNYTLGTLELEDNGEFKKCNYELVLDTGNKFKINGELTELQSSDVTFSKTLTYNGAYQDPGVVVKYNGNTLVENEDYTLELIKARNVKDTGKVTVTGIGDYTGTVEKTYNIKKCCISVLASALEYYKEVGEDDPEFTCTYSGCATNETPVFSGFPREPGEKIGEYMISFTDLGDFKLVKSDDENSCDPDNYYIYLVNNSKLIISGCKVTFHDGTGVEKKVEVKHNGTLEKPDDPKRTNEIFTGWYTDEERKDLYDFTSKVNDDFTLYAGWFSWSDCDIKAEDVELEYDGKKHGIEVTGVPDNAVIKYSTYKIGNIYNFIYDESPVFKSVGEHIIYYRVSIEGLNDYIGSAKVIIKPNTLNFTSENSFNNGDKKTITKDDDTLYYVHEEEDHARMLEFNSDDLESAMKVNMKVYRLVTEDDEFFDEYEDIWYQIDEVDINSVPGDEEGDYKLDHIYNFYAEKERTYKFVLTKDYSDEPYEITMADSNGAGKTDDGFTYRLISDDEGNDVAYIVAYNGKDTDVTVPATITEDNYNVKGLSSWLFYNKPVENVTIEEGIEEIGKGVFYNCSELVSLTLPSTLKLNDNIFLGCKKLEQINVAKGGDLKVKDSILYSLDKLLYSYSDIKEIKVEEDTSYIADNAFDDNEVEILYLPYSIKVVSELPISLKEIHFRNKNTTIKEYGIPWTGYDEEQDKKIYSVKVYAPAGGTIESYCSENGIEFTKEIYEKNIIVFSEGPDTKEMYYFTNKGANVGVVYYPEVLVDHYAAMDYIFKGWKLDGDDRIYSPEEVYNYVPKDDVVFRAVWVDKNEPEPTASPTAAPTGNPTASPTAAPTGNPTASPTAKPTGNPTASPTAAPTGNTTASPTVAPTSNPTAEPTAKPTSNPTAEPTASPTTEPTTEPTTPTDKPTAEPTAPADKPTTEPTSPADKPTAGPSAPASNPTTMPTTPTGQTANPSTGSNDDKDSDTGKQDTSKKIILIKKVMKKNAKKITGSVSVSGAVVKIKVGNRKTVKAKVKGKNFTIKLSYRLKKKTKVKFIITKKNYIGFTKTYTV